MRAMVMGLWVKATKRVSERLRIASRRCAKSLDVVIVERRVDFVEDADRSRVGQGHGEDSASAVSACSPPDKSVSVCGFLPGG